MKLNKFSDLKGILFPTTKKEIAEKINLTEPTTIDQTKQNGYIQVTPKVFINLKRQMTFQNRLIQFLEWQLHNSKELDYSAWLESKIANQKNARINLANAIKAKENKTKDYIKEFQYVDED